MHQDDDEVRDDDNELCEAEHSHLKFLENLVTMIGGEISTTNDPDSGQ